MRKVNPIRSRQKRVYITDPNSPSRVIPLLVYRITKQAFLSRNNPIEVAPLPTFPLLRGRCWYRGKLYATGGKSKAQVVGRLAMMVLADTSL